MLQHAAPYAACNDNIMTLQQCLKVIRVPLTIIQCQQININSLFVRLASFL